MAYAIVKTGGKQYRVEPGQSLLVEKLDGAEGDTVALEPILFRSEEAMQRFLDESGPAAADATWPKVAAGLRP